VDLSALIFVALAVAWAAYLVPKALKHHEEVHRSRSVERFSHTMRVLARREPVSRRAARLVVTPMRRASRPAVETKASGTSAAASPSSSSGTSSSGTSADSAAAASGAAPAATPVRRPASAAQRRRRVLGLLVLATAVVVTLAGLAQVHWGWVAAPATLLVGWLVACRLMVRGERARRPVRAGSAARAPGAVPTSGAAAGDAPDAGRAAGAGEHVETSAAEQQPVAEADPEPAPGTWQMVPTTLPTYVDKPAATRRTVQTIDLESTGVWSSGRNESDSALAREAEAAERSAREQAREQADARRVSGA